MGKKIAPEDNNGWTKIYDESDLPSEEGGMYQVIENGCIEFRPYWKNNSKYWLTKVTHFQKVELFNLPPNE